MLAICMFPLWEKEYAPVVEEKKARSLTREFTTLVVKPNGQITEKPAFDAAIERGLLTTIDGLEFMPNEPPGAMVYRRGRVVLRENDSIHGKDVRLVFNTFHGLPYPPEPHPDREIGEHLIRTLVTVMGSVTRDNPDQIRYIKNWFAHLVQYPGTKNPVALALAGGSGIGKTTLADMFPTALLKSAHVGRATRGR